MSLFVKGSRTNVKLEDPVPISIAVLNDNSIIAAPGANKQIVITHLVLNNTVGTTNKVTFKSGANGLSGAMLLAINGGGIVLQTTDEFPVLFCRANEAFIINLSAATNVAGYVIYYIEG